MSATALFTLPRPQGNSPAMQRINARAAEIWREVNAAKAALAAVQEEFVEVSADLNVAKRELAIARIMLKGEQPKINRMEMVASIKESACRIFAVTPAELISARRQTNFVTARWYVAQRLADEATLSLPHIGRVLGGRDHTTIIHALRPESRARVAEWLAGRDA